MRIMSRSAVLGAAALAFLAVETTVASAACPPFPVIVNKCSAGKKDCAGKKAAGLLKCHSKAQKKGLNPNTDLTVIACIDKAEGKFTDCYVKLNGKQNFAPGKESTICPAGITDTAVIEAKVDAFVEDVVCELSTTGLCPPIPTITNSCSAGKKDCAGKKAAALLKCHSKAQKKGLNANTDATVIACINKAVGKFSECYTKLNGKQNFAPGKESTICPAGITDTAVIEAKVDAFVDDVVCELSLSAPTPTPTPTLTQTPTATPTATCPPGPVFQGSLTATAGRFNYNLTLGLPGANSACSSNFSGAHACTYFELQCAQAAGSLVGATDTSATAVTSFWAIDPAAPALSQCLDDVSSFQRWEYATAHTASRGQKVDLNNGTGMLGPLQIGIQCNFAPNNWVGCCQ